MIYIGTMLISAITSIIVTKILATYYFEIVNDYVADMCNKTKDFVDKAANILNGRDS